MSTFRTNFKHDAPTPRKRVNHTIRNARRAKRAASEAVKRSVYELVDARDRYICRATGRYVGAGGGERHHILPRSRGGTHTTGNVVTLRTVVHERIHAGHLTCTGSADATLTFHDKVSGHTWESPCPS